MVCGKNFNRRFILFFALSIVAYAFRLLTFRLNVCNLASAEGYGVPTSIDFIRTETSQMVASYSSAQCVIYDLETAAPVVTLDSAKTYSKYYMLVISTKTCLRRNRLSCARCLLQKATSPFPTVGHVKANPLWKNIFVRNRKVI